MFTNNPPAWLVVYAHSSVYIAIAAFIALAAVIVFLSWPTASSRFRRLKAGMLTLLVFTLVTGAVVAPATAAGGTAKTGGEAPPSDPPVDRLFTPGGEDITGGTAKSGGEAPPTEPDPDRITVYYNGSPIPAYFYPESGVLLVFFE